MRRFAPLAALALAACASQPDTLPNPYVRLAAVPVRVIGAPAGASPFAAAVAAALGRRGFAVETIDAVPPQPAGPYADPVPSAALAATGVDAVLEVAASQDAWGRPGAATATVSTVADGAVVAAAEWRPRYGGFIGRQPLRRPGAGYIPGSDLFAAPAEQIADALTEQIAR